MKWIKQGRIFAADGSKWWARSYALIPTVDLISDAVLRIYFAALDEDKIGRIGYIDVAAENPKRILYESEKPVLDIGDLGTFDDSGVNPSCIITVAGKKYLYYIGRSIMVQSSMVVMRVLTYGATCESYFVSR